MSHIFFRDSPDLEKLPEDAYGRLAPLGDLIERAHGLSYHASECNCTDPECRILRDALLGASPSTEDVLGWLVAQGLLDLEAAERFAAKDAPESGGESTNGPELRTPTEWAAAAGIRIHAIDGWKRDGADFTAPVTREEFDRRVQWCSAEWPAFKPAQGLDPASTLATVWPDPLGRWTAEQADAARTMKAAMLRALGVPGRSPRAFTATDPIPAEEGLILRDENGDEAEYRGGAWRWRVIDGQRVTGDDSVLMAGPVPDLSYPATEVLPAATTTRGMR